jgi:N-acetylmuramoyl-L-alanine amidase
MAKVLIALDDGHGMNTPGKRSPKLSDGTVMLENQFNSRVVAYLDKELKRCGFSTLLVAPTDEDTSLSERVNRANKAKADFYLSVHANAFNSKLDDKAGGIETFAHFNYPKTVAKAKIIHKWVMKGSKIKDRGVKNGDWLYVCQKTNMESVLIELGFMDNIDDLKLLMNEDYRKECAIELAKAFCEIYNAEYVPEIKPKAVEKSKDPSVVYEAHVQSIGWQGAKKDGQTAGTTGQAKRLEALTVKLEGTDAKLEMQGHVEGIGWASMRTNGEVIGTMGESLRLEAVKLKVEGLNIEYRVHVQSIGWTEWAKNGEVAGTTGQSKRIEAIEIRLA